MTDFSFLPVISINVDILYLPESSSKAYFDEVAGKWDQMRINFRAASGIEYRVGESESLPVDDQAVDYAFAHMYLHHVERPAKAIQEMARILKPGGRLVITDLNEHNHAFLVTEQHDCWMGFSREEVAGWFTTAGLKNVTVDCTDQNCCADSECGTEKANVSVFIAYGEK